MRYCVEVINEETDEVEKSIECKTKRDAEKVENGLIANLNHELFYTVIRTSYES